ncbi:MAG: hypothetical protein Q9174_000918 [Haloplaca sp. 1 TL-2023]
MRVNFCLTFAALFIAGAARDAETTSGAASPSVASKSASIVPGTSSYNYQGCYNETTGNLATGNARALASGSMNASDAMTVERCLKFCGGKQYAGLEYGREVSHIQYLHAAFFKAAALTI